MPKGFLYVLINPAMPGLAKVGKTTRQPADRVAELSSATGVPSPFMLAFQQPVANCHTAEAWVHGELERGGYRLTDRREFFNAPLHVLVQVVARAADLVPEPSDDGDSVGDLQNRPPEELANDLYELGMAYIAGTDAILRNESIGLKHIEQAAALGHEGACSHAGIAYRWGMHGVRQDAEKALRYFNRSVAGGAWQSLASIAGIFLDGGQESAAETYWGRFFDAALDNYGDIRDGSIRSYGVGYCEAVAAGELKHCIDDSVLTHFSVLLHAGLEKAIVGLKDDPEKDYAAFKHARLLAARKFVEKHTADPSL